MQGISISLKGQFRTRGSFGTLMTCEGTNAGKGTAIQKGAGKAWSDALGWALGEASARSGSATFTPCVGGLGRRFISVGLTFFICKMKQWIQTRSVPRSFLILKVYDFKTY